jgi:hypothetical protein
VDLGIMEVPAARRASAPGWRDPRLWVGLAIVAASVLAGALVLGSSDDTVPVWTASGSLGVGRQLTSADLTVRRVRFADARDASLYLRADQQLPGGLRLGRPVGAGELVPRAALTDATGPDLREVPLSVAPGQVPADVRVDDRVDVYLRPADHTSCPGSSVCDGRPVLADVAVVETTAPDEEFGTDGSRTLVLDLTPAQARDYFALLATTDGATPTVVVREPSR